MALGLSVVLDDHGVGKIVNGEMMSAGEGDPFIFQKFQQLRAGNLLLASRRRREAQRRLFHFEHSWPPFQYR